MLFFTKNQEKNLLVLIEQKKKYKQHDLWCRTVDAHIKRWKNNINQLTGFYDKEVELMPKTGLSKTQLKCALLECIGEVFPGSEKESKATRTRRR